MVALFCLLALTSVYVAGSNEYKANFVVQSQTGITADLTYTGTSTDSAIIKDLRLNVTYETQQRCRIRITNPIAPRWEVPNVAIDSTSPVTSQEALYAVSISDSPFSLEVYRKVDHQKLFYLSPTGNFKYNDQDIIWENQLGYETTIFGLGERVTDFNLAEGIYTIFSRDQTGIIDNGKPPGKNMYSSHPVYLSVDSLGVASGGFLLNSNAMDVTVNKTSVTFRTIGGIIDYYAFVGPEPENVLKQYHSVVGLPVLVPYWSFGWHNCRWGYRNLTILQEIVANYTNYRVPLDVMWTDIDYMLDYEDFTLDSQRYNYPAFAAFTDSLHKDGRRFVPITDAGIANKSYSAFTEGLQKNVFIKSPHHQGPLIGKVWPGYAVFIDWFNSNTTQYWHTQMDNLKLVMDFDGLWIDMNEPSNFCLGECNYTPSFENLPYTPGKTDLNTDTVDLGGLHVNDGIEYNMHNLYGLKMAQATSSYFTQIMGTRPFVLGRSSFPSHGRYASKWLGDNFSTWEWMAYSIPGVFNFQIFGIPLVGADICGFNQDTNEELCARWYQLGALYPFARKHNTNSTIAQDPWSFGDTLLQASINAIRTRYSLINYIYTNMFMLSLYGGSFFKPTFFNYPEDPNLVVKQNSGNFMLGDALIVHPVLQKGATTVEAYFPSDIWYNWFTGTRVKTELNRIVTLEAPLRGFINIHMRAGYIIPASTRYFDAMAIQELRTSNITLVMAPDYLGTASGFMVFDDGLSPDTISAGKYTLVNYVYQQVSESEATLSFVQLLNGYIKAVGEWPNVEVMTIYGCPGAISSIEDQATGKKVGVNIFYNRINNVCWANLKNVVADQQTTLTINFQGKVLD